jgi:quercetin dioxygenase-like cupin family protein
MKVFFPLLLWLANAIAVAQGPVAPDLAPQTYKLLFENKKVRVIEEYLKPHEKEPMHSHPYGVLACFLTDAHFRTTFSDGKAAEGSQKAGDTVWRDPVTHSGENIGDTEIDEIMIEPKSASQGSGAMKVSAPLASAQMMSSEPMPTNLEPHHHVKYESQSIRILEVLLKPGESSFFHTHSNDILYVTLADASARAQDQGEDWGPETCSPLPESDPAAVSMRGPGSLPCAMASRCTVVKPAINVSHAFEAAA